MDIQSKIDEMERIAKEIDRDIDFAQLYFSWSISLQRNGYGNAVFGMDERFSRLRKELYAALVEAGALPPQSGPGDGDKPGPDPDRQQG